MSNQNKTITASHIRNLNPNDTLSGPTTKGGSTVAYQIRRLSGGEFIAVVGYAVCSVVDTFRRSTGRAIATGRVQALIESLEQLNVENVEELTVSGVQLPAYTSIVPLNLEKPDEFMVHDDGGYTYVGEDDASRSFLHSAIVLEVLKNVAGKRDASGNLSEHGHLVRIRKNTFFVYVDISQFDSINDQYFNNELELIL